MTTLDRLAAAHKKRLKALEHIGKAGYLTAAQVGALTSENSAPEHWRKLGQKILNRIGYVHEPTNASQCRQVALVRRSMGNGESTSKRQNFTYQLTKFGSDMLDQEAGILVPKSVDVRTEVETWWHRTLSNWVIILESRELEDPQVWYEHEIASHVYPRWLTAPSKVQKIPDGIIHANGHTTWIEIEASHKRGPERITLRKFIDNTIVENWHSGFDAIAFYAVHPKFLKDIRAYLRSNLQYFDVDPVKYPGTKNRNISFIQVVGEKRTALCKEIPWETIFWLENDEEAQEASLARVEHQNGCDEE